jgi:hypothetical protein
VVGVQRLAAADRGVPLALPALGALPVSDATLALRSVARSQAPGETPAPAAPLVAASAVVSRLADEALRHPPELGPVSGWSAAAGFDRLPAAGGQAVQRSVAVGEVAAEVAPAEAAGGGAAGGGGAPDDDELADRVYDRIRARFATELLLDRERMGLLIDG